MRKIFFTLVASLLLMQLEAQTFTYDFETDAQGWKVDWADYYIQDSLDYKLSSAHKALPGYIKPAQKGIYIKGFNASDDLFMFLKKKITGLQPNKQYNVQFQLQIASDAPTGAVGAGGDPPLFIKVGAVAIEPKKEVKEIAGIPFYKMNIDKSNQSQEGTQMHIIGDTGVNDTTTVFALIERKSSKPFYITTNAAGEAWVIVGTESAYESLSELYYSNIVVKFEAVTASKDVLPNFELSIYPNPSHQSTIYVDTKNDVIFDGSATYSVFDALGKRIYEQKLLSNELDLGTELKGVYFIKIKYPALGEVVRKVILM